MEIIEGPNIELRCGYCNALLRIFPDDIRGDSCEGYFVQCAACHKHIDSDTGEVLKEW